MITLSFSGWAFFIVSKQEFTRIPESMFSDAMPIVVLFCNNLSNHAHEAEYLVPTKLSPVTPNMA